MLGLGTLVFSPPWDASRSWGGRRSLCRAQVTRTRKRRPERRRSRPGASPRVLLLDRYSNEAPVLGPGTVVVADVFETEQLTQHEPGMRRALADPAVRDDFLVRGDAFGLVQGLELVGFLEGAVFV